jgi:hypothetical protein
VVDEIAHGDPEARRSSMISTHHTLKRLSGGIAVAAVLAALVAPAALARQDDPWFYNAVAGKNLVQAASAGRHDPWFYNVVAHSVAGSNATFTTDTLAPGGGSAQAQAQGYRFVTDTLAPGGGIVAVSPSAPGFDWSDAGIGAGGTIGLIVILLGGTRLMSQRRGPLAV